MPAPGVPLLALVLLAALACGRADGPEGAPGTVGAAGAPPSAPLEPFPGAGVPPWSPVRERGIGVLGFAGGAADTLVARARPAPDAPVLARLVRDSAAVHTFAARPGTVGAAGAPPSAPLEPFPGAGVPPWSPVRERGIGVLGFAGGAADTLVARARPAPDAPVLARLVRDSAGVHTFAARPGLLERPGALEYGYEEVGLPVLERGDGWARVYLGEAEGSAVEGWARVRPGRSRIVPWEELLPRMPLFFALPAGSVRFHEAPEGPEAPFALEPGDGGQPGDYILWPVETRGDWMRVRAVTPSDYCFDPPAPREDTLWIRWRGPAGRPRVWFYTRGC